MRAQSNPDDLTRADAPPEAVLDALYAKLGDAVLLPIPFKEKGPTTFNGEPWLGWQQTTFDHTQDPEYQAELIAAIERGGNLGVLLGRASGNLVAIDLDDAEWIEPFLALNPKLGSTFRSAALHGCQIWTRMIGPYPGKTVFIKNKESETAAEWRAGSGSQSVVWGEHKDAIVRYRWPVDAEVIEIRFKDLRWLADWDMKWSRPRPMPEEKAHQSGGGRNGADLDSRIGAYVNTVDFAVEGQGGSTPTYRLACALVNGWALDRDEAIRWMRYYSETRCDPPWTDKEIGHKVDDAMKAAHTKPRGHLRDEPPPPRYEPPPPPPRQHDRQDQGADARPELWLPVGDIEFTDTAKAAFPVLAKRERYFVRGQIIVELSHDQRLKDDQLHDALQILDPDAFRSRIEQDFRCVAWRTGRDGKTVKKVPARLPHDTANVLLKTTEAFQLLPPIKVLSACPALAGAPGKLQILEKGYHHVNGGIYVLGGSVALPSTVEEARNLILDMYRDYDFVTESDKSRAIAGCISPALRAGQLLGEVDFPLDLSEANASQSGKTFRHRIVHATYGETPYLIAEREGGVGSIDESISSALIAAKQFVMIDDFQGCMRSELLNTCLRGVGFVGARIPHRGERQVPTSHVNWQLSSNGMESRPDFANRTIVSRICKHPADYKFHSYPEGNILAHIKANQPNLLGAIFAIIKEWDRQGRLATGENRHDFREWCRALDWIVQNLFELPPLLDGHTEELLRMSSPALTWLRKVAIAVEKEGRLDEGLLPHDVVNICNARGVEIAKGDRILTQQQELMTVGKILATVFTTERPKVAIDRYEIHRVTEIKYIPDRCENITKHFHWFKLRPEPKSQAI